MCVGRDNFFLCIYSRSDACLCEFVQKLQNYCVVDLEGVYSDWYVRLVNQVFQWKNVFIAKKCVFVSVFVINLAFQM